MMSWWESLRLALDAIIAHRVRSALTTLGITIGIAAVTLSVGLAQGATASVSSEIGSLGSNLLTVMSGGFGGPTEAKPAEEQPLTMADADALADPLAAPDIAAVAPVITSSFELSAGDNVLGTSAEASTVAWATVRARTMAVGDFFTQADYDDAAAVIVLGTNTATELFGDPQAALGGMVSTDGNSFRVVGVLASAGSGGGIMSADDVAVMPLTTYRQRLSWSSEEPLSAVYVLAAPDRLTQAYQETEAILMARRGAATADEMGLSIMSCQALVDAVAEITAVLTMLLGGIAAISLIVGGIGVMNIMLVSVSERTREIGLRKALGARRRTILSQFLTEAAVLALVGGAFGLALSAGVAWLVTTVAAFPVPVSVPTVLMALGVSASIGIIAGVYPAARASRLAPIDALRRE